MSLTAITSFLDALQTILKRAYEDPTDTAGDWYEAAQGALIEAWRWAITAYPWLDLVKSPPGSFVTVDDITGLTLTVAAAGTGVAGTLSASQSVDLTDYRAIVSGYSWRPRITAHTPPSAAVTLDAVPAALSAVSVTLYKDEYTLASDLGVFVDGLWAGDGGFVTLISEEALKSAYGPHPGPSTVASEFARLGQRRIRLSHYPTSVQRYEYPYCYEPSDPSGSGAVAIGTHLIPAWVEKALSILLEMKMDRRYADANTRAEQALERAIQYETRRKMGVGQSSNRVGAGPYAETARYSGYGA